MAIRLLAAALFGMLLVAGCNERTDRWISSEGPAVMQTPFDPQAAAHVREIGTAVVTGRGSVYIAGNTYFAEGSRFMLIPVTDYSTEYIGYLFGGKPYYDTPREIHNVDQRFSEYMAFARGGVGGAFAMYGVSPGDYYLYVAIPGHDKHFYGVYRRITVVDGQTHEIDLDGT